MEINKYIIVALDGAAGSGKSTTAHAICEKYKYIHVDTGLHYRAISLYLLNLNISQKTLLHIFIPLQSFSPLSWIIFLSTCMSMESIFPNLNCVMKE